MESNIQFTNEFLNFIFVFVINVRARDFQLKTEM